METCEQQIFPGFEDESLCCQQASPASRPPLPGSAEAIKMTVGSGAQCSMLFNQSSPLGVFSKILLGSSHWTNSEEFCYVWNRLDTKFGVSAFQLTPLGQSIGDSEYSLWPTAHANCSTGAGIQGRDGGLNLQTAAKLWPTPRKEGYDSQGKGHGDLVYEVKSRLLPTPISRDWKSTSPALEATNSRSLSEVAGQTGSGSLNPRFVEELMGFPIDHTALKCLEMQWSRLNVSHSFKPSMRSKLDHY